MESTHIRTNYYLAFNKEWFEKHQTKLLWLVNTPLISTWFRRVLRIHGKRSDVRNFRITHIYPNAIRWNQQNGHSYEFRTHWKYAKRLYFTFKPIWWAMHYWDALFAEQYAPRLSFGFPTLTAYPDPDPETATVDGYVQQSYILGSGVDWGVLVADAGSDSNDTAAGDNCMEIRADNVTDKWRIIIRGVFLFDTSSIADGDTIDSATLSLFGSAKFNSLSQAPNIAIYSSTPASNTVLAAGDYDSLGTQNFSPTIAYADWNTAGYNDFTLNANGLSAISKTGVSKFGSRNGQFDADNFAPTWGSIQVAQMQCSYADFADTNQDPKLVVVSSGAATQGFSPSGGAAYGGIAMY